MTSHRTATPSTPLPGRASRRQGSRRWLVVGIGVLLAVGGTAAWLKAGSTDRTAASPPAVQAPPVLELLPQDVAQARYSEVQQTIELTGTLQPLNRSEIKAPFGGQVKTVDVREGEPVRQGQVLVTLDSSDLQARLRDRLGALEGGQAQLALARKTRENNQTLLARNFISQAAFDSADSGYQSAEAAVKSLQAQVEQARKALADAVIRSPIDGVVAERIAEPGLSVPANGALLSVHDLSQMELEVPVPTAQIPAVQIGQQASFRIEGFDAQAFDGQVERISPSAAAGSRSISVFIRIGNTDRALRGGMFAQGSIAIANSGRVLVVPVAAVRADGGGAQVLRIDGTTLEEVAVTLGKRDSAGSVVEVVQGLSEGDRIVVSGAPNIRPGRAVQVVTPLAQTPAAVPPTNG